MRQGGSEFDLLLVGGGHSHVSVLKSLAMKPLRGVRVTLLAREIHTPYSGMLPGHIAGLYDADDIHIDLGPLAHAAGARLVHDELRGLDPVARRVLLADRPAVRYDALSLDTGSTPALGAVTGDVDRVIPVKPISGFLPRLSRLLERIGGASTPLDVVVVGGGAGGVELCLALDERLTREGLADRVRLHLACAGPGPLESARPGARRRFERALAGRGVRVHRDCRVRAVTADGLRCDDAVLPADEVLWVTQAGAPAWARDSGLSVDADGFVEVGPTLQSVSHPDVFAAGDLAMFTHAPRPRSGVYAVRAGPVLARNLRAWVRGEALEAWRPQRRALYLVTTGGPEAVVVRDDLPALQGRWIWRLKDRIDRAFMRRFSELPTMSVPHSSDVAAVRGGGRLAAGMRCVGCGSKLGTATLLDGLGALPGPGGVEHFEDAARLEVGGAVLQQTMDGFPLPLPDPWLSGRIATIHALGDVHAMGAAPVGALALAVVPFMAPQLMADELAQLMDGVSRELDAHGCALLGGHSCEGAEGMIGLSVTGRSDPCTPVLTKGGGRAGDVLILTKALGTGVVLAATTDGRLPSRHRAAAVAHMLRSNADAVAVLRAHEVGGCTDVTGFGLLGHALELAEASRCALTLLAGASVSLPGAEEALAQGFTSSLQPDNEALLARVSLVGVRGDAAAVRLLADPQTCGGLLASVPAAQAERCLQALRSNGFDDARIVGELRVADAAAQGPAAHEVRHHGA
jgi:selenide,water dikinase